MKDLKEKSMQTTRNVSAKGILLTFILVAAVLLGSCARRPVADTRPASVIRAEQDKKIAELRTHLDKDSANTEALLYLAEAIVTKAEFQLQTTSTPYWAVNPGREMLREAGRLTVAALRKDPQSLRANRLLGTIHRSLTRVAFRWNIGIDEDFEPGIVALHRALRVEPGHLRTQMDLAELLLSTTRRSAYDSAVTILRTILTNEPRNGEACLWLGAAYGGLNSGFFRNQDTAKVLLRSAAAYGLPEGRYYAELASVLRWSWGEDLFYNREFELRTATIPAIAKGFFYPGAAIFRKEGETRARELNLRALELQPHHLGALQELLEDALIRQSTADAEEWFLRAARASGDLFFWGESWYYYNRRTTYRHFLRGFVQRHPEEVRGWIELGKTEIERGFPEDGIRNLNRALNMEPGARNLAWTIGVAELEQGRFARGDSILRPVIPWADSIFTTWNRPYYTIADLYLDKFEYVRAKPFVDKMVLDPKAQYYQVQSIVEKYRSHGKKAEATDLSRRYADVLKTRKGAEIDLAAVLYDSDRHEAAAAVYTKLLQRPLDPSFLQFVLGRLADIRLEQRRYREVIDLMQKALALVEKSSGAVESYRMPFIWRTIASAQIRSGEPRKAMEWLQKVLEADPNNYATLLEVGRAHEALRDTAAARWAYASAAKGGSGEAKAGLERISEGYNYIVAGRMELKRGNPRKAIESLLKAMALDANGYQAYLEAGRAYEALHDTSAAWWAYQAAARWGDEEARKGLKRLGLVSTTSH